MRLKPAMQCQIRDYLLSFGGFLGVYALCMVVGIWGTLQLQWEIDLQFYSWYDGACAGVFLMFGIIMPRQVTRLCVQMGVSRKTAYLGIYLMAGAAALGAALAGRVLMGLIDTAARNLLGTGGQKHLFLDLFQNMYCGGGPLTALDQVLSVVMTVIVLCLMFSLGLFFSFLFWRLNKMGCILAVVVIVAVPTLFQFLVEALPLVPALFRSLGRAFAASPWSGILLLLVGLALLAGIGWFLIRQTNIRGGMLSRQ